MMKWINIKTYRKSRTASFAVVSWIGFECSFSDFQLVKYDYSGQFANVLTDFSNNVFQFQMYDGVELHEPVYSGQKYGVKLSLISVNKNEETQSQILNLE